MPITKQTVFILGAGASAPYGYPTGIKLYEQIANLNTDSRFEELCNQAFGSTSSGDVSLFITPALNGLSHREIIGKFTESLKKCGLYSIDRFMKENQDYRGISKFAITYILLKASIEYSKNHLKLTANNDWYRYFYNEFIYADNEIDLMKNNVGIVNFNYDTSFMLYLYQSLTNKYGAKVSEEYFQKNLIFHIHGSIRHKNESFIDSVFRSQLNSGNISLISQGINYVHEPSDVDSRVHGLIANAKQVVFLGFGYDDENLAKLKIEWSNKSIAYYGTAFGMTQIEYLRRMRIANALVRADKPYMQYREIDCLGLLRNIDLI